MATLPINLLLVLTASAFVEAAILEMVDQDDLDAVCIRLGEEKSKMLMLQNGLEVLMVQVEELRRAVSGNRTFVTPSIAFTATLSRRTTHAPGQTVIFDNVKANEGNCYDSSTGRFRASYRGLYSFSVTVVNLLSTDVHLLVMKDNDEVGRVFSGQGTSYSSGSVTVVTVMDKGQMVYIKQQTGHTKEIMYGENWATFTGLLQARYT